MIVANAYPTASYPQNITVNVSGVLNPTPAVTTDEFLASVGNDAVLPGASNLGHVELTPAEFKNCTLTFSPGNVNKTGNMVVGVVPRNGVPVGGYLEIEFPIVGYWKNDLALTNQTFRLTNTMACASLSVSVGFK